MSADLLTLDAAKRILEISTNQDDDILRLLIASASGMVEQYTGRSFAPLWQTRRYDASGDHITAKTLVVWQDLLEVSVLTNGDDTVIDAADLLLVPYDEYPKRAITIKASSTAEFTYNTDWQAAISVQGVWGYHEAWESAWVSTLDAVQDDALGAGSATITVSNSAGVDARGIAPRFEVLGYYRIDNEVVQVTNVTVTEATEEDPAIHALTVTRGALGTTAAEHAQGAAITRYLPMQDIELGATSLLSWLYRNKAKLGDRYQFLGGEHPVLNEAPKLILTTLNPYRRLRVGE